jgi:hypothetical protein
MTTDKARMQVSDFRQYYHTWLRVVKSLWTTEAVNGIHEVSGSIPLGSTT